MGDDWDPFADPADDALVGVVGIAPDSPKLASAPSVPKSRKIRVLCLHGTCSSNRILRMQIGSLIRAAEADFEFIFSEGTIKVDPSDPELAGMVELMQKAFNVTEVFQYAEPTIDDRAGVPFRTYQKLDECLAFVRDELKRHSPIDFVLGFSQGANIANLVAAQAGLGLIQPLCGVVHMCAHKPGWVDQKPELFMERIQVPALVIAGAKDAVSFGATEVAALYEQVVQLTHSSDHRPLPAGKEGVELAREIIDWMALRARG